MKRRCISKTLLLCILLSTLGTLPILAQENKVPAKPAAAPMKLKVGDLAPDFKLQYFDGSDLKDVTLSQYRGKSNVVLAFYVFAFTGG